MRHAKLALIPLALALLSLGGCTLTVYNNYRDIESLEVVQVVGIDAGADGGVKLSVATGSDASGREPLRLTQEAESLDGAMRAMEQLAGPGSLFFSGTGAIVLGEEAAHDVEHWLDAVARSKELRLDVELYVLRHGEAQELLTGDDAPEDVFASLDALASRVREDGPAPVPTCTDISRALLSSGAALATAIGVEPGPDEKLTPVPDGFAVLTASGFAGWLSEDEALGAGLFCGGPGISVVELSGSITAEMAGADVAIDARWSDDGELEGIDVDVSVKGSIIEAPAGSDLSSEAAWEKLQRELAEEVYGWVDAVLEKSRVLLADFLGLGRSIETKCPVKYAAMPTPWQEAFPDIEPDISVSAQILNMREYSASPFEEGDE